ncbi:MAG: hypothetical protein UHE62_02655 [Muribaculaceae bacterium]|nr:hypothetical protein [Muribaculaceae bacterium]
MKKLLLFMAVGVATIANAQQFEVTALQEVKTGGIAAFHPRFMPDGKTLLVSQTESYDGLSLVNVKEGSYSELTNMPGAAWCCEISEDGKTVLTRSMDRENFTHNIYTIDVATKKATPVITNIDHINNMTFSRGVVQLAHSGGKLLQQKVADVATPLKPNNNLLLTNEDLKMVLYVNGVRNVLDPLAGQFEDWDPQYIWTSISPDGKKILFYCQQSAYTCDLNGQNVVKIGKIQGPKWIDNDYIVGMDGTHDGYFYEQNEIYVCKKDGTQRQQLTSGADKEIKMLPAVSADGSQIAYYTQSGKLFLMTIKKK